MKKVRLVSKSPVLLCGMRPVDETGALELAYLSLYEFMRYWRVELAAFPRSERERESCLRLQVMRARLR